MLTAIKRLFAGKAQKARADEKSYFAARHHRFKLFLNAWGQLQEALADMEACLYVSRPYSAQTIQALCTKISIQTLQCLRRFAEISESSMPVLDQAFARVQSDINAVLQGDRTPLDAPLALPLDSAEIARGTLTQEVCDPAMIRLTRFLDHDASLIPPAFILTAAACQRVFLHEGLQEDMDRRIQAAGGMNPHNLYDICLKLREQILHAPLPAEVQDALLQSVYHLRDTCAILRPRLLLRGRIWPKGAEQPGGMSLWGPILPLEGVTDEAIIHAFKTVLAKKYDPEAVVYRHVKGLPDMGTNMCVGCFAMGRPHAGGVAYSRNPFCPENTDIYLCVGDSLPETVERGGAQVDIIYATRQTGHSMSLHCPGTSHCADPLLTEAQALRVSATAEKAEELLGAPQEIEWIFDPEGELRILHVRPLRHFAALPDAAMSRVSHGLPTPLVWGGNTACPGIAHGVVHHVQSREDVEGFPEGGIALLPFDSAEWCVVLDRACGVLAMRGSVSSRLAGMCRELGIPALFGLKNAFDVVPHGQEVTFCAESGSVYPGTAQQLLQYATPQPRPILTSPLHDLLKQVAQHTLPLTIVPDTPEFKAAHCVTLHDIGRYCAENATDAMFRVGSHKNYSIQRVKQLMDDVVKQFWVVNLDEAFRTIPKGPYIHINDIECPPMQALWYGMNVKAWEGPPPVDGKGFLSVLFESTANPHIDPANQSTFFTEKNYFLASGQYCGLHSRFGYHFVAVEALASKRNRENYIVFILRGGAADIARRVRRVEFVGGILKKFGFVVDIRNDALRARADKCSFRRALRLARVAGYLVIHTRQLDMIMADAVQAQRRQEQLISDCQALFALKQEDKLMPRTTKQASDSSLGDSHAD